jgi:DNA-binding transcriptional LysR family regulator
MQINQLKCFVMAAKYGSITKVAEQLHVSQPAISSSISLLEKELGVNLFESEGRQIKLSIVGKRILVNAQMILDECNLITHICNLQKSPDRTVTFTSPVLPMHTTAIARSFMAQYPDIQLVQAPMSCKYPEIIIGATTDEGFSNIRKRVMTEEIGIVVPPDHELVGREVMELRELEKYPVMSLREPPGMRALEDHFCAQAGFELTREREFTALSDILEAVYEGSGIAFFPFKTWGIETIPTQRIIRLRNPRFFRHIYVEQALFPSSNQEMVQYLFDFVLQYFSND